MSPLLSWFASPEWARLVEALLHSLWEGALLAAGLLILLRFVVRPKARYQLAVLALTGLMAMNLVTWAVLQETAATTPPKPSVAPAIISTEAATTVKASPPLSANPVAGSAGQYWNEPLSRERNVPPPALNWSAWLAVVWILGAVAMLIRAGSQLAGAGRMRRGCCPLPEGPVRELLEQMQQALGIVRRIQVVMTDQLASPAVVGVLVPTLILPVSLVSTLAPEQLRFIFLHELAHVRRGDYLVNLFQLMVEALLFFNPAVWWISRQIRIEREACCDAAAIEFSGAPAEYARTLLQVAERYGSPEPAAAMAFGDTREPSSLAERIHRLLKPGHRPQLRLTWRAMIVSLAVGGGLLVLSALGTRATVAAILSPEQRMDRIEQVLVAHNEEVTPDTEISKTNQITFSGRVRTEDGSPLPKHLWINSNLRPRHNTSYGTCEAMARDGTFHGTCQAGELSLVAEVPGYAPCFAGPIKMQGTNAVSGIELVLSRGFAITIQMMDQDAGTAISNGLVVINCSNRGQGFAARKLTTDFRGEAVMTNCASLPLDISGNATGYEVVKQSFPPPAPGQTLRLAVRQGKETSGLVLDKATGRPIAGALIQLLPEQGAMANHYIWERPENRLTTSDERGHFVTAGLRQDASACLGVSAPGHESIIFHRVLAGDHDLVARLGPELVVHGRVTGNFKPVNQLNIMCRITERYFNNSDSYEYGVKYWPSNDLVYFQFTNQVAGPVELLMGRGFAETRIVDAPVPDWLVELTNSPASPPPFLNATSPPVLREVVVRLKTSDGTAPRGSIDFTVPSDSGNLQSGYYHKKVALRQGEARVKVPVGAQLEYAPDKATLGYWFESGFNWTNITAGNGPIVIEVPAIPAGIITARARNADGSPAGNLSFNIQVLKPSPAVKNKNFNNYDQGDSYADDGPRQYVSPPLPLGGKYKIIGWRGNLICASEPIKLTGDAPDQAVELQFGPAHRLTGRVLDASGQPVRGVTITGLATVDGHGFGLNGTITDGRGGFQLDNCSPELADYSLDISGAGFGVERVKVDFNHLPLTVKLKPAFTLSGQVVEAATGYPITGVEVRAWDNDGNGPTIRTSTDADGHYELNTLNSGVYRIYVDGANFGMNFDNTFRAGKVTNWVLQVTPYQGSQVTVKRPKN